MIMTIKQQLVDYVNSHPVRSKITKDAIDLSIPASPKTLENYRTALFEAGYLKRTQTKGLYQVAKRIPKNFL
jgi:hypothetical protein